MGYYTKYRISMVTMSGQCDSSDSTAFVKALNDCGYFVVESLGKFNNLDTMKWYEHEEHIAKAMKHSGATCVVLSGEGEENGDRWDKTFSIEDDDEVWCRVYRYEYRRPELPTSEGRVKP